MKKVALALALVVVLLVVAVAVLFFGGFLKAPEIKAVNISWGEVTAEETVVHGQVRINNRLPVGLGSSNVGLEVMVDFYEAAVFTLALPAFRLDKGESTLDLQGTMRMKGLPMWWPEFVNNGEVLAIRVRPRIHVKVLGRQLEQGFPGIESQASMPLLRDVGSDQPQTMGFDDAPLLEIVKSPGDHFVVGPPKPSRPLLTIESWEIHWGTVTQETTQLLGTIVLVNEMDVPLPVQGLGLGIDMNKIEVVPETRITPSQPVLPPKEPVPFALDVQVDNDKLVQWWATHLQRGEETDVTARIGVTVVLPKAMLGGFANDIELPLIPVPGFKCIIKTDIMGTANYQVGKALGIEAGEEPEAAVVDCPTPKPPVLGEVVGGAVTEPPVPETPSAPISPPAPPGLPGR